MAESIPPPCPNSGESLSLVKLATMGENLRAEIRRAIGTLECSQVHIDSANGAPIRVLVWENGSIGTRKHFRINIAQSEVVEILDALAHTPDGEGDAATLLAFIDKARVNRVCAKLQERVRDFEDVHGCEFDYSIRASNRNICLVLQGEKEDRELSLEEAMRFIAELDYDETRYDRPDANTAFRHICPDADVRGLP